MNFDRQRTKARLELIEPHRRVVSAALCAERLLPYYWWFSKQERWGDYECLRRAVADVWNFVDGSPLDQRDYQKRITECESVTPDTEDFKSALTSRAMDAAVTVTEALRMCIEPSPQRGAEIAEVAVEAAFGIEQMTADDVPATVRVANRAELRALLGGKRVRDELHTQEAVLNDLQSDAAELDVIGLRERYGHLQ